MICAEALESYHQLPEAPPPPELPPPEDEEEDESEPKEELEELRGSGSAPPLLAETVAGSNHTPKISRAAVVRRRIRSSRSRAK